MAALLYILSTIIHHTVSSLYSLQFLSVLGFDPVSQKFLDMPSLSDAFKSVPVQCKEPDISSMDEVPELYLWPQENQQALEENIGVNIPVIDLQHGVTSRASAGSVIELLRAAYEEFGVFQIVNHGVSQQLLERVENQGRRLFSLPLDQKIKARRSPDGVTGYGMPRICTFFDRLMWSEGFTSIGSPLEHAEKLWPDDYQDFWYL